MCERVISFPCLETMAARFRKKQQPRSRNFLSRPELIPLFLLFVQEKNARIGLECWNKVGIESLFTEMVL